jgi:hypothetical protein
MDAKNSQTEDSIFTRSRADPGRIEAMKNAIRPLGFYELPSMPSIILLKELERKENRIESFPRKSKIEDKFLPAGVFFLATAAGAADQ